MYVHVKVLLGSQLHRPNMTEEHSQKSQVFDFSEGRKTGGAWEKPSWHIWELLHDSNHKCPSLESNQCHRSLRQALYTTLATHPAKESKHLNVKRWCCDTYDTGRKTSKPNSFQLLYQMGKTKMAEKVVPLSRFNTMGCSKKYKV